MSQPIADRRDYSGDLGYAIGLQPPTSGLLGGGQPQGRAIPIPAVKVTGSPKSPSAHGLRQRRLSGIIRHHAEPSIRRS